MLSEADCIGLPLATVFQTLLGSDDPTLIDQAIGLFRERFEPTGMFENALYPDVREAPVSLRHEGHQMRIVTTKPEPYAARILQHFRIDGSFEKIHGPSLEDRTHKKTVLEDRMKRLVCSVTW